MRIWYQIVVVLLVSRLGAGCGPASVVLTPSGLRPVGVLRVGDFVVSYNPEDGSYPHIMIRDLIAREVNAVYAVSTSAGSFIVSRDQDFYFVAMNHFAELIFSRPGNMLLTKDLGCTYCTSIFLYTRPTRVYELVLEYPYLFFVGNDCLLTHSFFSLFNDDNHEHVPPAHQQEESSC